MKKILVTIGSLLLALLAYAAGLFGGSLLVGPLAGLLLAAGLSIAAAYFMLRKGGSFFKQIGLVKPKSWGKTILTSLLIVAFLQGSALLLFFPALDLFGLSRPDYSYFQALEGNLLLLLIYLIPVTWGTAAFGEEILVRGFILNKLIHLFGNGKGALAAAIILQGFIFGFAHIYQGLTGALYVSFSGIILGFAYVLSGRNLWVTVIAHGTFNSVGLILAYFGIFL